MTYPQSPRCDLAWQNHRNVHSLDTNYNPHYIQSIILEEEPCGPGPLLGSERYSQIFVIIQGLNILARQFTLFEN